MARTKKTRGRGRPAKTETKGKKVGFTSGDMSEILFNTMVDLRAGKIDAREATSVAAQSNAICRIAKLQLDAARVTGNVTHLKSAVGLISG